MKPPVEPNQEDCCNSGCNPCIFDVYEEQLKLYQRFIKSGELPKVTEENGITQLEYAKFKLVKSITLCELHKLLLFRSENNKQIKWKPAQHFLFKYVSNNKCCTRAYTPINMKLKYCAKFDFAIVLKAYHGGLVSNFLFNLKEDEMTLWRGPYGSYELIRNASIRKIMIAQGTGIATFLSIIEQIVDDEDDMTKLFLFYCTKNEDTILFRNELYSLRQHWNFNYKVFLNVPTANSNLKYQEPIVFRKFDFEDLLQLKPFQGSDEFLLSGSEQFMSSYQEMLQKESNTINIYVF